MFKNSYLYHYIIDLTLRRLLDLKFFLQVFFLLHPKMQEEGSKVRLVQISNEVKETNIVVSKKSTSKKTKSFSKRTIHALFMPMELPTYNSIYQSVSKKVMLIRHFDLHCGNFLISLLVEEDFFRVFGSENKNLSYYSVYKTIGTAT